MTKREQQLELVGRLQSVRADFLGTDDEPIFFACHHAAQAIQELIAEIDRYEQQVIKDATTVVDALLEWDRLREALEAAPAPVRNEQKLGWLDLPKREAYIYWYVNPRSKALKGESSD